MVKIQQSTSQVITNSSDEKSVKPSKRLKSLDSLRGFAIFCMVLFHGFLQLFGKFSLTMYLLESFFGSLIKLLILDKIFPGWAQNIALVVCYSFIIVILWVLICKVWIKFGQIGSYDWMTSQIKKKVRKTLTKKELKLAAENPNTIIHTES